MNTTVNHQIHPRRKLCLVFFCLAMHLNKAVLVIALGLESHIIQ